MTGSSISSEVIGQMKSLGIIVSIFISRKDFYVNLIIKAFYRDLTDGAWFILRDNNWSIMFRKIRLINHKSPRYLKPGQTQNLKTPIHSAIITSPIKALAVEFDTDSKINWSSKELFLIDFSFLSPLFGFAKEYSSLCLSYYLIRYF